MARPRKRVQKESGRGRAGAPAALAADEGANATPMVVGIGASAGGLEALELLLSHAVPSSGLAYVVVQHLDPNATTLTPTLLQRVTPMPVAQITDGLRVMADHVYVIPPNKDLSILKGVLHLFEPVGQHGLRLPIDSFFRSLADDAEERSIGVVLSGMGSDGTIGLKAIKGRAGVAFVQDPATAKFASMPTSAVEAGLADVVAPAEEIPARIAAYLAHTPLLSRALSADEDETAACVDKIIILLRDRSGNDFSMYKRNAVQRRIERRMGLHQLSRMRDYVRLLREQPDEIGELFKDLLIGVTSFFRDAAVWEQLLHETMPALFADRPPSQGLRMWVTGCSTGEEAYSLAIVFREALDRLEPARNHTLQIFATDLDAVAIARARDGIYPEGIAADVSPERLRRFFVQVKRGYEVSKSIRESVIFAPHNVISDPPFTRLDLVSCRNLLIYLSPESQAKLFPLFHYSLNPQGVLLLGNSETVSAPPGRFEPVPGKARLFRRLDTDQRPAITQLPPVSRPPQSWGSAPHLPSVPPSLQADVERFLLARHTPAAVIANKKGEILFISGSTSRYLEPPRGATNWTLMAMAREGLRAELTDAFRRALKQTTTVVRRNVSIGTGRTPHLIDLSVEVLHEPDSLRGAVVVVFRDHPPLLAAPTKAAKGSSVASSAQLGTLREALAHANQELQLTRSEMQGSQEEVHSANEELQSANEELQSTNEELMTSKEESQSMNEELQTLNQELQARVDDLSRLTADMKNLLDSTDLATLFLDRDLCIRLFSAGSSRIFRLRPEDAGRPITDFASYLSYPELEAHARTVLQKLTVSEQTVSGADGKWFMVRILPYRTLRNVVDGVAITFTDITTSKTLEAALLKTQQGLEQHIAEQAAELARVNDPKPPEAK